MPQKNSLPDPSTLTFVSESEEATEAALRHPHPANPRRGCEAVPARSYCS